MISMRRSDEPILNAAIAAARGDRDGMRTAIAASEELAAGGGWAFLLRLLRGAASRMRAPGMGRLAGRRHSASIGDG